MGRTKKRVVYSQWKATQFGLIEIGKTFIWGSSLWTKTDINYAIKDGESTPTKLPKQLNIMEIIQ